MYVRYALLTKEYFPDKDICVSCAIENKIVLMENNLCPNIKLTQQV